MSDTVDKPIEDGFYCLDGNWRFVFVNRLTSDLLKRKPEELYGKVIWDEYPGLTETAFKSACLRVKEKRSAQQIEMNSPNLDRWYHVVCFPFPAEGISVYWRDITEEKRERETLAANEERMRLLLETYAQSFWEADAKGSIKNVSSTWRGNIDRAEIDEMFGGLINAIHPDDRDSARRKWYRAVAAEVKFDEVIRLINPKGEWRWLNATAVPMRNQDGKIVKWIGMNIDITDRKQFEMDLIESERRFRALTMATSELVYQLNTDCSEMTILSNNGFMRITQNPNRSWLNEYVPPEDHEKLETKISAAVRDKGILEAEHKVYLADGSVGWVCSRSIPLFDSRGEITKWFGVANNITERKKADESRNSFISTLSHELRNPLAAVSMGLTILKDAEKGSGQAEKALGIMERQTEQLSRLVDDLLDVTRITQNKIVLKNERIDLNDVVYHIVTDFQPYFSEKGVRLDFELDPDSVHIDADPARLTQVIGNLLHNAAKFTDIGDRVKVSVCHDKENKEQVFILVQDTGTGIDPSIQSQLFEPFVQADCSLAHSLGGLGLGLTIVKGIVELHGGSVSVSSEGIGKGTQFVIRLPLRIAGEAIENAAKTEATERRPPSLRILIIEDIPDLADIMSELLFHLGHEVIIALNGQEGIKKAVSYHPDVLISDIGLPDMSGYEIAEVLQKDDRLRSIYLIALSGYAQPEDIERSRMAGFRNHLAKPVNLENLNAALQEAYGFIIDHRAESGSAGLHVGIDGCEGKWVAVAISDKHFEVGKFATISDICRKYNNADTMIIDIPIGLPESTADIRPDRTVRRQLGPKGSSIFDTPCRQAVYAESKEIARMHNIKTLGKSLSEQSIAISKAIRQVDEFLDGNTAWKNRLLESHPEYCFMMLNDGKPVMEKKTEEAGRETRLRILSRYYPPAGQVIEKYLGDVPYRKKLDDVIDAMCLAVIGKLSVKNGLKTVPDEPMEDPNGLKMQIVYSLNK